MSFETPGWGGPPPAPNSNIPNPKRKRPADGAPAPNVESASSSSASKGGSNINLEKLMAAMEKEERDSKGVAVAKGKEKKDKKDKKAQEGAEKKGKVGGGAPGAGGPGGAAKKPFEAKKPYERKEGGEQQQQQGKGGKKDFKKKEAAPKVDAPPPQPQAQQKKKEPKPTPVQTPAVPPIVYAPGEEPPKKKNKRDQRKEKAAALALAAAGGGGLVAPVVAAPAAPKAAPTPKAAAAAPPAPKSAPTPSAEENTVVMAMDEDLPARKELLEAGLTPMQAKMKGRLEGARFRWINEQLYTTSSTSALEMMKADPSIFADYHTGFRHQSHSWPQSPLSLLLTSLSSSLPESSLIIDLGCGDAELAKTLVPQGYKVLSYDLVGDEWVTEADFCQSIPLPGGAGGSQIVDAAVCCLSLMGRNWIGGVREVARVVKEGGIFEVAEITSRMPSVEAFIAMVVSLGFTLKKKDDSNTHFMMLSFVRQGEPTWDEDGSLSWEDVVKKGEEVLKACVYKKR